MRINNQNQRQNLNQCKKRNIFIVSYSHVRNTSLNAHCYAQQLQHAKKYW